MFVNLPDDLAAPYDYLNKEVFPSVFDMLVDAFRRHAQKLDDPESPSEAWRAEFAAISDQLTDHLVWQYTTARETLVPKLAALTNRTAADEELIQQSVSVIRQQIRQALRTFYDLMEAAEFQLTYYENQGWDNGMKRRARHFRDDMHEFLQGLTPHGEPVVEGQLILPNLEEERQQTISSVNVVIWEFEKAVANLTAKVAERPAMLLERAGVADLLYDIYESRRALSELSLESAKTAALRLRKYVGDVNEKLGLPREPASGLLRAVWDEPAIEGTEAYAMPTETVAEGAWSSAEATFDPDSVADMDAMYEAASIGAVPTEEPSAAAPEATPVPAVDDVVDDAAPDATPAPTADAATESAATPSVSSTAFSTSYVTSDPASPDASTYVSSASSTYAASSAATGTPADDEDYEMGDDVAEAAEGAAALVAQLLQGFTGEPADPAAAEAEASPAPTEDATTSVPTATVLETPEAAATAEVTEAEPAPSSASTATVETEPPTATAADESESLGVHDEL